MSSKVTQNGFALVNAGLAVLFAEDVLRARLMDNFAELELARCAIGETTSLVRASNRPTGNDLGESSDILLRVAAINAQRVQLENFAGEILVEPELLIRATAIRAFAELRVRSNRALIVKVDNHGWVLLDGHQ